MKKTLAQITFAVLAGALTLIGYKAFFEKPEVKIIREEGYNTAVRTSLAAPEDGDFIAAAEMTLPCVVHVKTTSTIRGRQLNPIEELFFGRSQMPDIRQQGTGSGVIVSANGYIVTNNHVIANADEINVVLHDNRELQAKVIGTDPATDIALLKIDSDNLSFIKFGNSDEIRVGQWVLAVGNPFNLTGTVTAGIVSAKGRNINIIADKFPIEAFIQTDAAVNPGNSGGALVNTRGELVGINTAISSTRGSFEGYSFAVPSNIVKKVMEDLIEYGQVQRAFLGVSITDLSPALARELSIKLTRGVYINDVTDNGAAQAAGIRKGDIIVAVDGKEVGKTSELQEMIGRKRPGEEVVVTVVRDEKRRDFKVKLRNIHGTTQIVKKDDMSLENLIGAKLENLTADDQRRYNVQYGIKVVSVQPGGKFKKIGVPEGFIIVSANNRPVRNLEEFQNVLKGLKTGEGVLIQGIRPDGRPDYFGFGWGN
ncbi:Do family serine endopeptidase [Schleiferia thermophila]|jgi:Do/DeqQ family serine protease|uniref:Do family serine endopeptidase n=1 Tax=Schleiferia thermophila TaxID=884107 RepID=UPI0005608967|nr:Do family serine endopeptidase [Schleiferia thermophila]PMB19143.1 deoxyribonuclease HsdR [Fischerella thermalis CCMEE 5319]